MELHFAQSRPPSLLATSFILMLLLCRSGCDSGTGVCTGPNVCTCELGYWGTDCSHQCTCMNGICDDGKAAIITPIHNNIIIPIL